MFSFFKLTLFYLSLIIFTITMLISVTIKENLNLKDNLISSYNFVINFFGKNALTSDRNLQGKRIYGVDTYVGKYTAKYDGFTGEEILFGGTTLSRKNKDYININIKLEKQAGDIKVINRLGNNDKIILDDTGRYSNNIYIEGTSYYLVVKLDNFEGNIEIEIN